MSQIFIVAVCNILIWHNHCELIYSLHDVNADYDFNLILKVVVTIIDALG